MTKMYEQNKRRAPKKQIITICTIRRFPDVELSDNSAINVIGHWTHQI